MSQLIELDLGDGRTILVESDDEVTVSRAVLSAIRYQRAGADTARRTELAGMQDALRGFVDGSVAALREVNADIEQVQFEFSVSLGGEAGVPYITKGGGEGALKVTVQCNLAKQKQRLALDPD
jgi:hypothetical protein